jgi:2-amino-4-hydroxy-6-hydroxymethyldihydropteridine diphosphokinase
MSNVLIALGGNLGDVKASFDMACQALEKSCHIITKSKLYRTPAIGPLVNGKQQPDYLNAAIHVVSTLSATDLLLELHRIEATQGRERKEHWGARTLDLDLLDYEGVISDEDTLSLPHPRIQDRLFVLQPITDIDPNWTHPKLGLTALNMLKGLTNHGEQLFKGEAW